MPRKLKPVTKPADTPLPPDWRPTTWRITAMMNKIDQTDYEVQWQAFAAHYRGRLSADWTGAWRDWCRNEMLRRYEAQKPPLDRLFG